jgi:poly(A) polymerase Pap1
MDIVKRLGNKEVFSFTLRILKAWAKARGIYSANFGYLNGITITIMLAKVEDIIKGQAKPEIKAEKSEENDESMESEFD